MLGGKWNPRKASHLADRIKTLFIVISLNLLSQTYKLLLVNSTGLKTSVKNADKLVPVFLVQGIGTENE